MFSPFPIFKFKNYAFPLLPKDLLIDPISLPTNGNAIASNTKPPTSPISPAPVVSKSVAENGKLTVEKSIPIKIPP